MKLLLNLFKVYRNGHKSCIGKNRADHSQTDYCTKCCHDEDGQRHWMGNDVGIYTWNMLNKWVSLT